MADFVRFKSGLASSIINTGIGAGQLLFAIKGKIDDEYTGSIYFDKDSNTRVKLNADAYKLAKARSISLAGGVTGSVEFDGSTGVTIQTTVTDNSHKHTIANITGLQTALGDKMPKFDDAGSETVPVYFLDGAPMACTSISLNANTASKWKTGRLITVGHTGKTVDGSSNVTWSLSEIAGNDFVFAKSSITEGTMNDAAKFYNAMGMIYLTAPSSGTASYVNPNSQTGWHHFINISFREGGAGSNSWITQIANEAGSTDLWVRSRAGGTISNDTSWRAPWTRIVTGTNFTSVLNGTYVNVSGDTMTDTLYFSNTGATSGVFKGIRGVMADNDYWRVGGSQTAANAGYLEIATGDDGNEPIYVRQYTGVFTTLIRTLTLLDSSGNTSVPGSVSAAGAFTAHNANAFRMVQGNYGAFWRNDGGNTYLLVTASGDQYGSCTDARPISVNNSTGICNINGNAATATILATARTINGTSFNGSANITTSYWGAARTLTIGNKGQSVNGSANVSWDLHDILYNTSSIGTATSWAITTPGVYPVASNAVFTGTGNPESAHGGTTPSRYGQLIVSRASTSGVAQFYISYQDSSATTTYGIKFRTGWNSSYVDTWRTLLDSTNYTNWTDGRYVNVAGDTMTGALNFANNTWNTMGDDAYIGDCNQTGVIGIKGKNGNTGIYFAPYSGSTAQTIIINGSGTMTISGTVASTFSGNLSGNASSATKLATARDIALGGDFTGSASFNGTANATITATNYKCNVNGGNTNSFPYHRIAYITRKTDQWSDSDCILDIKHNYNGGGFGRIKISFRTNSTGSGVNASATWLYRYKINEGAISIAYWGVTGDSCYADVFYNHGTTYPRCTVYQAYGNRAWTLVNSNQPSNGAAATEAYTSISAAATALHGGTAYTAIVSSAQNYAGVLPVAYGGTGATTKLNAKTNLGITYGTALPSSGSEGDIFFVLAS